MPEITRSQLEAGKHTMIRRAKELSPIARLILAELIDHDFIDNRTGMRKGEVWCSQQRIANNLGVSRATISRHIKEVVASPFVQSVRYFQDETRNTRMAYCLNWDQIQKHTIQSLTGEKVRMIQPLPQSDPVPQNDTTPLPQNEATPCIKVRQETVERETVENQTVELLRAFPEAGKDAEMISRGKGRKSQSPTRVIDREKGKPQALSDHDWLRRFEQECYERHRTPRAT